MPVDTSWSMHEHVCMCSAAYVFMGWLHPRAHPICAGHLSHPHLHLEHADTRCTSVSTDNVPHTDRPVTYPYSKPPTTSSSWHTATPHTEPCDPMQQCLVHGPSIRPAATAHHRGRDMACPASSSTPGTSKPIVVVGSVNADLVVKVQQLPRPGETIAGSSLDFFPGGKGANQAAAAARLGHPTYFIGQVGSDSNAAALTAALQQYGVRLDQLRSVPGPSGTALILLQQGGENSIVIVGGANTSHWEVAPGALQLVQSAGAVLLQREIPEPINQQLAAAAAAAGVPVMWDAGGQDLPLPEQLLPLLAFCSPNETELSRLTGLPTGSKEEVVAAARSLMIKGVKQVLVKLGAQGCVLLQGPGADPIWQPALPVPQVVDTTGAGDCFTAAFMAGLLQGLGPAQALRWASAAASLCVQRAGAMPSMPEREEVEAVLRS